MAVNSSFLITQNIHEMICATVTIMITLRKNILFLEMEIKDHLNSSYVYLDIAKKESIC